MTKLKYQNYDKNKNISNFRAQRKKGRNKHTTEQKLGSV